MPKVALNDFGKGLWVGTPQDAAPPTTLRQARGLHRLPSPSIRARAGSYLLTSFAAAVHSVVRFFDQHFVGAGTVFYLSGSSIKTDLSGERLRFCSMPPTPGKEDYLFVVGDGDLFKVSQAGAVSLVGIVPPPDGFVVTKNDTEEFSISTCDSQTGAAFSQASILVPFTWTSENCESFTKDAITFREGTHSLVMVVAEDTLGKITRVGALDLSTFGTVASPEQDVITLWVFVDRVDYLEKLQVEFSLGNTKFSPDSFSRTIDIGTDGEAITAAVSVGVASDKDQKQQADLVRHRTKVASTDLATGEQSETTETTREQERIFARGILGSKDKLPASNGTWYELRLPKETFLRAGDDETLGWANVQALRLSVQTNEKGSVTVRWDDIKLVGGTGMQGTYQYLVTYLNSTTGTRSLPNPNALVVEDIFRQGTSLSNLPVSTDTQVDTVEIWRTLGDGNYFFRAGTVANGTTTFTDEVADYPGMHADSLDYLEDLMLTRDMATPASVGTMRQCLFHAGRSWWITREDGRVYYSPLGYVEGIAGFVIVNQNDDPIQHILSWNGRLYAWSESSLYEVLGTNEPFFAATVYGVPGTRQPDTIALSPEGVYYRATDGVRLFSGGSASLVAPEAVQRLFLDESLAGIPAIGRDCVGAWGTDGYFISDNTTTLNFHPQRGWRVLPAASALYYDRVLEQMLVALDTELLVFEENGNTTDDAANIPFLVETQGVKLPRNAQPLLRRIYVEADTDGESLDVALIYDDLVYPLPALFTSTKQVVEYELALPVKTFVALRLTGTLSTGQPEIHGIEFMFPDTEPDQAGAR